MQPTQFEKLKAYYDDRYHDDTRSPRPVTHYRIYLRQLGIRGSQPGKRLLDVGCGKGQLLQNARALGLQAVGVDISFTALRRAQREATDCQLVQAAGEQLAFQDGVFDYVCCLGSLEHFPDTQQALTEMLRVATPAARFCILVPNVIHYRPDAASRWGIKKVVGTRQQEIGEQLHTLPTWKRILEQAGLQVDRIYRDRFFIRKANPLKNVLFYLWLLFLPYRYSYQFIFICSPAEVHR